MLYQNDEWIYSKENIIATERRAEAEMLRRKQARLDAEAAAAEAATRLFTIQTGNDWVHHEKQNGRPKMLFGELWYQGELCIMFADSNAGKSVLAVQIGDGLTRGHAIEPFTAEVDDATVLYIDFELTGKQFEQRYNGRDVCRFGHTFYRAQFNPAATVPPRFKNIYDYVSHSIAEAIAQTRATVLIIDNITNLRGDTANTCEALPLMNHLKLLKAKHNLSILVLAHTPKRNPTHAITGNHMGGSKMLLNFCDSAFAIGVSQTRPGLRYIKQIKQRNTPQLYGTDKVCLYRISNEYQFLSYNFEGYDTETAHLYGAHNPRREQLIKSISSLAAQGLSQRKIARRLNIAVSTVNVMLNEVTAEATARVPLVVQDNIC